MPPDRVEVTCKPLCQLHVFPCERRSQAHSSWEQRGVLAAKLAVFPRSHPKCFPATGRTIGLVPPAGRSWDTIAGLQHPPRDPCPASFHSFQAVIWHGQVPAVSPKPGFKTLPQIVFLLLQTEAATAQWAAWLSPSTKCTADALCQLMLTQDATHIFSPGASYLLKAGRPAETRTTAASG